MRAQEFITDSWSQKYKNSINCSHPKGFSQRAHCAGKKKHEESIEMEMVCPDCGMCETHGDSMMEVKQRLDAKCWKGKHKEGTKIKGGIRVNNCVPNEGVAEEGYGNHPSQRVDPRTGKRYVPPKSPLGQGVAEDLELEEQFNIIESMVEYWAEHHGVDSDAIWEDLEEVDDEELLSEAEAWQKSSGKNKNGGLNKKGVASYRKSHPGSHLQTAVTTKPSKLKKGSKAAKRRKSFCARMKGMKKHRAGAKTKRDPNSRINKSLRKWNCH